MLLKRVVKKDMGRVQLARPNDTRAVRSVDYGGHQGLCPSGQLYGGAESAFPRPVSPGRLHRHPFTPWWLREQTYSIFHVFSLLCHTCFQFCDLITFIYFYSVPFSAKQLKEMLQNSKLQPNIANFCKRKLYVSSSHAKLSAES